MSKELIERLRSGEPYNCLVKEAMADRVEKLERTLFCAQQALLTEGMQRDALLADNERLRETLCYALQAWKYDEICDEHGSVFAEADSICNSTPRRRALHESGIRHWINEVMSKKRGVIWAI